MEAATDKFTYFSFYETSANTGHMLQEQMETTNYRELTMLRNHHTLCLHFICFEINGSVLPQIASGSLGSCCVTEFTPNGKNFSKQEEANRFIYVQWAYLLSHFVGPFPSP